MTTNISVLNFDRTRLALVADWLAVGTAVSLPWSTSATAIFIVVWLVALLPTMDFATIRREVETAAGGLPVLLWCLAAIGMLWADVSWAERIEGLGGFHRLLVIPLLLAQFRRSGHGAWVLLGFLLSASVLVLVSWVLVLTPGLAWRGKTFGVPVKDYIFQSAAFLVCAFAAIGIACAKCRAQNFRTMIGLIAVAGAFICNLAFVVTSRTAVLVAPALIVLLGWRQFGWKGTIGACLIGAAVAWSVWMSSPYLRDRMTRSVQEMSEYRATDAANSTGIHVELLKKSLQIVASSPLFGHGTGSIRDQFRRAAVGVTGAESVASDNPHNQTFAVAIQLGVVGAAVLLAMWAAHFYLFTAGGPIAWVGTVVVAQNVISSLVNSHLFDFANGWFYVLGVGVAGGTVLRRLENPSAQS